jgi:hypothetical protein
MTLPGFTAEKSLYQSPERYLAVRSGGSRSGEHIAPAGLFRWCEGFPPKCCTCDLTNGGCDCSNLHTEM